MVQVRMIRLRVNHQIQQLLHNLQKSMKKPFMTYIGLVYRRVSQKDRIVLGMNP